MFKISIVSGGQTGADRAALDAALSIGVPCGGWCPKGRKSEDGKVPDKYPLKEHPSSNYLGRTEANIRDSDGTLILNTVFPLTGGTKKTEDLACGLMKPVLVVDPLDWSNVNKVLLWIDLFSISTLNIAGPRESKSPGIHATSLGFLKAVLNAMGGGLSSDSK